MGKIPDPSKMKRIEGPRISKEDLKNVKVRITTYIDKDLLETLKLVAQKRGGRYQTLLNEALRMSLTGKGTYEDLFDRIDRLEKQVFKNKKAS